MYIIRNSQASRFLYLEYPGFNTKDFVVITSQREQSFLAKWNLSSF